VVDADFVAGAVMCSVVGERLQVSVSRVSTAGAASHSFAWCCMKPCGRPRWSRGREAIQLLDRTRGWVMALPGLHEVLVSVMPRPKWR
jgi:hypothetical protein